MMRVRGTVRLPTRYSAVSLVELLVVLGLVTVLVALLVPATVSARRSARVAGCTSNLRQIGQVLAAYRVERGSWPVALTLPEPFKSGKWDDAPALPRALADYLPCGGGGRSIFRCPGDDSEGSIFAACETFKPGDGISYCYFASSGKLLRGTTIVLFDFLSWSDGDRYVVAPIYHPPYRGSRNALDADGSVTYRSGKPGG